MGLVLLAATALLLPGAGLLAQSDDLSPSEIAREQREFSSHLDTAEHDLEQAQRSYQVGTFNLAWLNVSNAGLELDKAKPKMEGHPQRIARARVLLNANNRRERMRDDFYQIRDRFYDINRKVIALEVDVGLQLGLDITYVRQLREALSLMLPHITDPALRSRIQGLLQELDAAVRSGDVNRVNAIRREIENAIAEAIGKQPELRSMLPSDTQQSIERGGSEEFEAGGGAQSQDQRGSNGQGTDQNTGDGDRRIWAESKDSSSSTTSDHHASDRRPTPDRPENGPPTAQGGLIGPHQINVGGIIIDFRDGRGVEVQYEGGRGAELVKESEKILQSLDPVRVADGATREWDLDIDFAPVANAQAGAYEHKLNVVDFNGNDEHFKIHRWRVLNEEGSIVSEGPAGNDFHLRIDRSGTYDLEAHGESDWGSAFVLKRQIRVNL